MKTTMTSRITQPVIVDAPETKKTRFVARWYLRKKNDERTQFEYKDHDPTRHPAELIIDFVLLKFVLETKIFTLDAGTVEVLGMAVKHRDEIDAPVESTSTKSQRPQAAAAAEAAGPAGEE